MGQKDAVKRLKSEDRVLASFPEKKLIKEIKVGERRIERLVRRRKVVAKRVRRVGS